MLSIYAQDVHHRNQDVDSVDHGSFNQNEAIHLKDWFGLGRASGLLRTNSMATFNEDDLTDHAALAAGGRLYFHTAYLKGFQMGIGGLYTYNLVSTDLAEPDPVVNKLSRWERQLFDLTDPHNKTDLDRLEELFIKYRYQDSYIKFGKMVINTPLVNAQDSRMKPTALSGVWFDWNEGRFFNLNGGWFRKASPRATTDWRDVGESIGAYGTGVNPDGSPSGYRNNTHTDGLLILGGHLNISNDLKIHLWEYQITNVLRASFFQTDFARNQFQFGVQYLNEGILGNGGNPVDSLSYMPADNDFQLISGKAEYRSDNLKLSVNSTLGFGSGRFTFPRELGTANIFTYISRLRVEGLGDFSTHTIKINYFPLRERKCLDLGFYYAITDTNRLPEYNKYGFVSDSQFNFDIKYKFRRELDGLDIRMLTVVKTSGHDLTAEPSLVFNKTNLVHFNLVTTYKF